MRSVLWRSLRDLSSSFRAREVEVVRMALEVGSIVIGRSVKVSMSSMMVEVCMIDLKIFVVSKLRLSSSFSRISQL